MVTIKELLQCSSVKEVIELINHSGGYVPATSPKTTTLLHEAVKAGSLTVVQGLIQAGAASDLLQLDEYGFTPLHWAVIEGKFHFRTPYGWLELEGENGRKYHEGKMAEISGFLPFPHLGNINAAPSAHYVAIIHYFLQDICQDVEGQRDLEKKQQLLNAKTLAGETPLFLAATQYRLATTEALLNNGADVNATRPSGWGAAPFVTTPLIEVLKDSIVITDEGPRRTIDQREIEAKIAMAEMLLTRPGINPTLGAHLYSWQKGPKDPRAAVIEIEERYNIQNVEQLASLLPGKAADHLRLVIQEKIAEQKTMQEQAAAAIKMRQEEKALAQPGGKVGDNPRIGKNKGKNKAKKAPAVFAQEEEEGSSQFQKKAQAQKKVLEDLKASAASAASEPVKVKISRGVASYDEEMGEGASSLGGGDPEAGHGDLVGATGANAGGE